MTSDTGTPTWARDLRQQAEASTPGPWYVRRTDDPSFMAAYYVTNEKGQGSLDVEAWDHPTTVVAITLLQDPSRAVTPQCSENADFIAAARTGVPRLCDALQRAAKERSALADAVRQLLVTAEMLGGAIEYGEAMENARRLLDELDEG